jgi:hypothetical protein
MIGPVAAVVEAFSSTETFQSVTALASVAQWVLVVQVVARKLQALMVVTQHFQLLLLKVAVVVALGLIQVQALLARLPLAAVEHQVAADLIPVTVLTVVHAVLADLEQPAKVIQVDQVYALT